MYKEYQRLLPLVRELQAYQLRNTFCWKSLKQKHPSRCFEHKNTYLMKSFSVLHRICKTCMWFDKMNQRYNLFSLTKINILDFLVCFNRKLFIYDLASHFALYCLLLWYFRLHILFLLDLLCSMKSRNAFLPLTFLDIKHEPNRKSECRIITGPDENIRETANASSCFYLLITWNFWLSKSL